MKNNFSDTGILEGWFLFARKIPMTYQQTLSFLNVEGMEYVRKEADRHQSEQTSYVGHGGVCIHESDDKVDVIGGLLTGGHFSARIC